MLAPKAGQRLLQEPAHWGLEEGSIRQSLMGFMGNVLDLDLRSNSSHSLEVSPPQSTEKKTLIAEVIKSIVHIEKHFSKRNQS